MSQIRAAITGVQGYVPDYILTNAELEKMVDTTDEWITTRTGIKERRILKGEGLGTSYLGAQAVKGLLEKTNTAPQDIDLLICATTTPDFVFPGTANLICNMVGIKDIGSFDVQAACSGFLYALTVGTQFIETGKYRKIIVVGADKMSAIVDYQDRTTCVLFGDGAGAVLLEPTTNGLGVLDTIIRSDGAGQPHLHQKAGGSRYPPTHDTVDKRWHYAYQDGPAVFKFAVVNMANVSAEIMQRNHLTGDDVAWLVPHQANKRIILATANRMNIGMDKVMLNIHKYGNTTAATIPLCLWDYESQLKKGDNLVLAAFGGGFTWGAAYLKWAY
ncbi:MAG: ketoacyl-ACP synthase III [Runella slithyformis]|nr:MAG: ketoacyl-ACP synthase III [Runella slithyformis]TAF93360.1 MAG: ketoacyl-ACP synthase III [Runella sp.]TAG24067.1 MAG: ketoacyl-ACP synthase III [Cytophagales bacterium]TAG34853.1 MAG: ketoacyl-ACP synthase III [Cytophagia bacterium]TAE98311.1 MAG: ketoacyl-ACP synthase III [Runella slithyformis]